MSSVPHRVARHLPPAAQAGLRRARDLVRGAAGRPADAAPAAGRDDALVRALRQGKPLGAGLVAEVRGLLRAGDTDGAISVAAALRRDPSASVLGHLCSGIVASSRGFGRLAWSELAEVPLELWSRFAVREYLKAGLVHDPERVLAQVRTLMADPPDHMTPARWMEVLERLFGHGEMDLVRELFGTVDAAIAGRRHVDDDVLVKRDWMQRWASRTPDSPDGPRLDADVRFAIVDYDHPGRRRASANIGDHVQTLASLGHLVRHEDLEFVGPEELLDLVGQLADRVRPERRLSGSGARVQVMTVDRDASAFNEVPEDTWVLAFGWYMHALFGVRYGFPLHHHLQPIFVSFHCNKRGLLTPEAIDYLRAHGPIGCRDWTTVDILLSVDVPAYFSGCLTTTIDTVFPPMADAFPAGAPLAYVDTPADEPGAKTYKHSSDKVRFRSFTGNMFEAVDLLETYRRDHSAVVTSRLHCYLPMRSLGAQVDFRPKNLSDIRFAGLGQITDQQFDAIRDGMNARLAEVMQLILSGASRDTVYARWRELCADDVAAARARRAAVAEVTSPVVDLGAETDLAVSRTRTVGAAAPLARHVAVRVEEDRPAVLGVLVDSLVRHASGPLHLWLLDRTGSVDLQQVAGRAPGHQVSLVPVEGLGAGLRGLSSESRERLRADLDLEVLTDLLPGVDRVAVLPQHALVTGDVVELVDLDLGDDVVAAPDVAGVGAGGGAASGFGLLHQAGDRLQSRTSVAIELRRQAHARHAFDFTAFATDVLVLDLAAMRERGVRDELLRLTEQFDLDAREAWHAFAGPHRTLVPAEWHTVPTREPFGDARLLHWADGTRPWGEDYAPAQEEWVGARARMRRDADAVSAG